MLETTKRQTKPFYQIVFNLMWNDLAMIYRKDIKDLSYVLPTDYAKSIDNSGDVISTVQWSYSFTRRNCY